MSRSRGGMQGSSNGIICAVEAYRSQWKQYFCLSAFFLVVTSLEADSYADRQSRRKAGHSELGIRAMIRSA